MMSDDWQAMKTRSRRSIGARVWITIGVIFGLVAATVGVFTFIVTRPAPTWPATGTPDHNRWYQTSLGSEAVDAAGGDYRIYAKTGTSDNLIIFFGGGGVVWDAEAAADPITVGGYLLSGFPGAYFRSIPSFFPTTLGGILDVNNEDNPFSDWNAVMIPYATGDFHVGDANVSLTAADGTATDMHFNGQTNVRLALDWIQANIPNPERLLIAGASAGSFGAAIHTPQIVDRYPESRIFQFSEGDQLPSKKWPAVADELWDAHWRDNFGYEPGENLYERAVVANREALGDDVVFLDSNTTRDGTLIAFTARVNDETPNPEAWSEAMRASMVRMQQNVPNYYFFLTDADPDSKGFTAHTLSSLPVAYTTKQDGVEFLTWLADAVIRDRPSSIGAHLLTANG